MRPVRDIQALPRRANERHGERRGEPRQHRRCRVLQGEARGDAPGDRKHGRELAGAGGEVKSSVIFWGSISINRHIPSAKADLEPFWRT